MTSEFVDQGNLEYETHAEGANTCNLYKRYGKRGHLDGKHRVNTVWKCRPFFYKRKWGCSAIPKVRYSDLSRTAC